jgi:hypothetical protein
MTQTVSFFVAFGFCAAVKLYTVEKHNFSEQRQDVCHTNEDCVIGGTGETFTYQLPEFINICTVHQHS